MKNKLILVLAALALGACKNNGAGTSATDGAQGTSSVETVYDIAYVQIDSLVHNYNRYRDLSATFEAKATKVQGDLEARARRLQKEVSDLEEKAQKGLATRSQLVDMQTALQTKGQQFENDRQARVNELAEEEAVMTNQIMHAIEQYIARFNAGYRYKMILSSSGGSPVMHATPALNITAEVLRGLNDEYAAEAPKK